MAKPTRLPNLDEQSLLNQLRVRLVSLKERKRWNGLVRQRHYLKNADLVGEQLRYVVIDAQRQLAGAAGLERRRLASEGPR